MKKFCSSFLFLCLTGLIFVNVSLVNAQGIGLKVSPTKIEDLVDPGEVLRRTVKVTNESSQAKTLYVYLKDFKAGDESGSPILIPPGSEDGYYLASWIDITSDGINFAPGEEKTIPFTVKVPENVGPGGYYGGIFLGTDNPISRTNSPDKGASMTTNYQTGSLILLQVKGDVAESAEIREFNTDKDRYNAPFDVDFTIRIQNKGNVHVKPVGEIAIENMFGKTIDKIIVNETGGNVLPGSIRKYNEHWKGDFGFGKYKAKLSLTYGTSAKNGGQGMQTMYVEKHFWVIPWKIVGPVIISAIVTFLLFGFVVNFFKNRAVKKAMERAGVKAAKAVKRTQSRQNTSTNNGLIFLIVFIIVLMLVFAMFFLFFS